MDCVLPFVKVVSVHGQIQGTNPYLPTATNRVTCDFVDTQGNAVNPNWIRVMFVSGNDNVAGHNFIVEFPELAAISGTATHIVGGAGTSSLLGFGGMSDARGFSTADITLPDALAKQITYCFIRHSMVTTDSAAYLVTYGVKKPINKLRAGSHLRVGR